MSNPTTTTVDNHHQQQQQQGGNTNSNIVGLGPDGTGKLKCLTHDYETLDKAEFHQHFCDPANEHTLSGTTDCKSCGKIIEFENIPYPENLDFKCDECYNKYVNQHQKLFSKVNNDGSSTPTINEGQGGREQGNQNNNSSQPTKEVNI